MNESALPAGGWSLGRARRAASPPAHERETVLGRYFTGIETEPAEAHAEFDGAKLMSRLAEAAGEG